MSGCKLTVKWLDTEFPRVLFETIRIHQRNRTKSPHVGVVKSSAVIEIESQRRIAELRGREASVVDEQCAGEARLYDDAISAVQVDHHQLGAAPAPHDGRV